MRPGWSASRPSPPRRAARWNKSPSTEGWERVSLVAKIRGVAADPQGSMAWIAMGAALGGVVLGGAAVYLGLVVEHRGAIPEVIAAAAGGLPAVDGAETPSSPGAAGLGTGANALADAVVGTRDTVVNLRTGQGLGAGVVVDPAGVILTNYHVVADVLRAPGPDLLGEGEGRGAPSQVLVRFENGRELPARVLFADRTEDIALLRLQPADTAETFPAAVLGRSADLRVGEDVFAIGNPFGLTHTLSRGIVSAIDRTDILANRTVPVIQLDAAINVGNSGGPLFNLAGQLVGIVTGRLANTGPQAQAEGIAFALPIDHVRAFLRAVTADVDSRSGIIGIESPAAVPPEQLKEHGYRVGLGVRRVWKGYPAAEAGMQSGDIIVELRGKRFDGRTAGHLLDELQQTVRAGFPGETLPLAVIRGGERVELELQIAAASRRDQAVIDAQELFGIVLDPHGSVPSVRGLTPAFALGRLPQVEAVAALKGSQMVQVLGRETRTWTDLGHVLAKLRALVESGQQMTVSAVFERDGQRSIPMDLPVAPR